MGKRGVPGGKREVSVRKIRKAVAALGAASIVSQTSPSCKLIQ